MNAYRRLIADIGGSFGWRLAGPYGLTILIGLTEGLGIAMLFPLLTRLGIAGGGGGSPLVEAIDGIASFISPQGELAPLIGLIIAIFALQTAIFLLQSWLTALYQRRYAAQWQNQLFAGFAEAEWAFLSRHKSGEMLNAIVVETGRLAGAFTTLAQLVATIVISTIYLVAALFVSWQVTLAIGAVALLLAFSVTRLTRESHRIGRLFGPLNARLSVQVGEYLSGIRLVKTAVAENFVIAGVSDTVARIERAQRRATFMPSIVRGVFEFVSLTGLVILLAVGPSAFSIAPANLLVVMALFLRLFPRLATLQQYIHYMNAYVPAIEILSALRDETTRHREPRLEGEGATPLYAVPTNLTMNEVGVSYDGRKVLSDISLSIPVPGVTAIVGASGAGKSTLVNVLAGLVRPDAGTIALGDIRQDAIALRVWRRLISYVSQEATLFHLPIGENIAFGKNKIAHADIETAARKAAAHDFILALPEGYDTQVGDQGARLSGGQRQRLAIARALLARPAILLLDEPTSALDSESEKAILDTLNELRGEVGIVIVTHRLATVRHADHIFMLEEGRLQEQGSWDELIHAGGRFAEIARKQHIIA